MLDVDRPQVDAILSKGRVLDRILSFLYAIAVCFPGGIVAFVAVVGGYCASVFLLTEEPFERCVQRVQDESSRPESRLAFAIPFIVLVSSQTVSGAYRYSDCSDGIWTRGGGGLTGLGVKSFTELAQKKSKIGRFLM